MGYGYRLLCHINLCWIRMIRNFPKEKWDKQRFPLDKGGKAVDPERPLKSVVAIGTIFG
jgi:hypothetical protein